MAPPDLVEEFADVITMVVHPQVAFDQIGDSLCGPQLGPVAVRHRPFGQEATKACLLFRGQSRGAARRGFGGQCRIPAVLHGIAPTQDAARVAPHASGNLMKGQLLREECHGTFPTLFQQLGRTVRSHGDTPFQDASMILHYLCGSQ